MEKRNEDENPPGVEWGVRKAVAKDKITELAKAMIPSRKPVFVKVNVMDHNLNYRQIELKVTAETSRILGKNRAIKDYL